MRPSWDQYFLEMASLTSGRSVCCKRQVGCVLVKDNHVISTGYNGPARGAPHPTGETCVRKDVPSGQRLDLMCCAHAESNAVALAAYHGISTKGSTAYCTVAPCGGCARTLVNAGIVRVVYDSPYTDGDGLKVFDDCGVPYGRI